MSTATRNFDWVPDLLAFLRRRWRIIGISTAAMLVLGVVYLFNATPKFTATSTLVIDTLAAASLQQQQPLTDSQFANGIVESQVEVLQSERVARMVVQRLHLADDPAFFANGHSLTASILGPITKLFSRPVKLTPDGREQAAAELLLKMMSVRRIGMSYVLELGVTARNRNAAATLANALVDAYVDVGLDAKSDNIRRAGSWLQQRLKELRDQALAADAAVQAFKAQANIVDTDKGLMSERHLGELNSQLVLARAHTAETRARYDRIAAILAHGGLAAGDVSDALQNEAIIKLRKDYDDAARQAAEWTAQVGPNHAAVKGMEARMTDIAAQIRAELRQIAEGYYSDYQEAQASEHDIQTQLDKLAADSSVTNANLVKLRGLQSLADTLRSLYENFLQRYTQAVQDQSFPVSEVQIVTHAVPPLRKSQPKGTLILAASMMVGLMIGFGLAFLRESLDHGLRSAAQVRETLGVACLGLLPRLRTRQYRRAPAVERAAGDNIIAEIPPTMRQAVVAPYAPFAEGVRGLRVRMARGRDRREPVFAIGCISALPGEGKTTISANLAVFLAQAGFRTLLIDLDLRRPALSAQLAPGCKAGFAETIAGDVDLADVLWRDPATGLVFLPAGAASQSTRLPPERLHGGRNATRLRAVLDGLRGTFDYIVVDLPAMAPVADATAVAPWLDGVLLVAEWGRTPLGVIRESLLAADLQAPRLLGVVLNKVDPGALPSYGGSYRAVQDVPQPVQV